jgi:Uncharacterized conserved protein, contains S4-like domain
MDKIEIIKKYQNEEEKILISKILDKIEQSKKRKSYGITDFLDPYQKELGQKLLIIQKVTNYMFSGGYMKSERNLLVLYPDYIEKDNIDLNEFFDVIKIKVPNEDIDKYTHRNYLGMLMKLGVKREKIGDIIVNSDGADIIVLKEISDYLKVNLNEFNRLKSAKIEVVNLETLEVPIVEFELFDIIVSSLRLDVVVAGVLHISRTKANDIITEERVSVNWQKENINSKQIKLGDMLSIRGNGRFEVLEIVGNTKKGRIILKINKKK